MPVRKIPRSYRNLTGRVAMAGQEDSAAFESPLERDFYMLLDFDPTVIQVEPQPIQIRYIRPNKRFSRYTPDALVSYLPDLGRKPMLCEIKTRQDLAENWADLKDPFRAAIRHCRQEGWIFRIYTEREIRTPYLENVRLLREFRCMTVDEIKKAKIFAFLRSRQEVQLGEVMKHLCPQVSARGPWLSLFWHLMATGLIRANLAEKLSYDTLIGLSEAA